MTPQERETYDRLCQAAAWRCQCDNAEHRARCSRAHAAMPGAYTRCPNGAFVLVTEPDGTMAVICRDCEADRAKTARRAKREARAARARAYAEAQLDLFDLLNETEGA